MMMDIGEAVGGNSSMLSALAPPFTIDRLNPNPNSDLISGNSNSPYSILPHYDAWHYPPPSASGPQLFMDSIGVSSVPILDAYQFSATTTASPSSSFAFGGGVDPCYHSYIPFGQNSMEGSRDKAVPNCAKTQLDCARSSIDWEYKPRWDDGLGFHCGKRAKMVQLDGNFQGGLHSTENKNAYGEEPGFLPPKFNQGYDKKFLLGSSSIGHVKDKPCLEQNISFFSYDANNTCALASSSTYHLESHPSAALACEMSNSFSSYQYDNPVQAAFSASRLSPTVVIKSSPDLNPGRSLAPCEISSDFADPPNLLVDSPWKGAPSSKISPFNLETNNCKYVKKKLEEYFGFGHEGHQNLHSTGDFHRVYPENIGEGYMDHKSEFAKNGGCILGRMVDALCSNKEQPLSDDATGRDWIFTPSSCEGVEVCCGPNKWKKGSLGTGFDLKGFDAKCMIDEESIEMTPNDASESGAVAVLVAEKVLASPLSHAYAVERPKPDLKLNMLSMIKTMQNLSELVLFHISNDECSLEEENYESLKHVIRNLDLCFSKKSFPEPKKPGPNNIVGSTFEELEDQSSVVETIIESSHTINKAANFQIKPDSQHIHQKDSCGFSGKKDEILISSSFINDLDIATNDNMAKAIKKVLTENLHFNEEMSSEALLFKNLWLEAEAKLCSINYKARFDRTKTQMETIKPQDQDHEEFVEMMSKVCISPDTITTLTTSEVVHEDDDETKPKPTSKNLSNCSTSELADDIIVRSSTLKSQEDNLEPMNEEEEHELEMVDGDVMDSFNIPKSYEDNPKLISTEEEEKLEIVGGGKNICGKNVGPSRIKDQLENEILDLVAKRVFQCQNDSLSEDGSYVDGAGCESPDEFYLAVKDDPVIFSPNSTMVNQHDAGGHDSPSSDWEHVLKDDF